MIFHNRKGQSMSWLKKRKQKEIKDFDSSTQWEEDEYMELEKYDFLAMIIAAIIVFAPIFLILIGILIWSFNP